MAEVHHTTTMESGKSSVEKAGIKYGIITAVCLILYFLLMRALGLASVIALRYLNFLILIVTMTLAIKSFKKERGDSFRYSSGIWIGALISLSSGILFTVFLVIYLMVDHRFVESIQMNLPMDNFQNPFTLAVGAFTEIFTGGLILSLILMQYFKPPISGKKVD